MYVAAIKARLVGVEPPLVETVQQQLLTPQSLLTHQACSIRLTNIDQRHPPACIPAADACAKV
jgi:hypothetical protein